MTTNPLPRHWHAWGSVCMLLSAATVLALFTGRLWSTCGALWDGAFRLVFPYGYGPGDGRTFLLGGGLVIAFLVVPSVWLAVAMQYLQKLFTAPPAPRTDTTHGSARWATPHDIEGSGLLIPQGIPLHSFALSTDLWVPLRYAGNRHLITVAPSRSGKGATSIIPALIEYPGSALVIDPKGQNAAVTLRRRERDMDQHVLVLNPFGVNGLPQSRFNPLSILDPASDDLIRDSASLAEALIVYGGHGDSHWTDSARELVQALILDVVTREDEPRDGRTLKEVRRLLTLARKEMTEEFERMMGGSSLLASKVGRFLDDSREVSSIISTAVTQTAFLDFPQIQRATEDTDFDFADLKRGPTTIYLVLPADTLGTCGRWLRLMISLALRAMSRTPGKPQWPVLFLLDEFAALGYLEIIERAAGLMAGYGIQLWPVLQDLPQLKTLYRDRWESFLANAGVIEFFRPNDLVTADYVSRRLGQSTQETTSHSVSPTGEGSRTSINYGSTGRPLLQPDEILKLDESGAVLFVQGLPPIWTRRTPYYQTPYYAGAYDPDPEHEAVAPALARS